MIKETKQEQIYRMIMLDELEKAKKSEFDESEKELKEAVPDFHWIKQGQYIIGSSKSKIYIAGKSEHIIKFRLNHISPGSWKGCVEVKEIDTVEEVHQSQKVMVDYHVEIATVFHRNCVPSALNSVELLIKIASSISGIEIGQIGGDLKC
jgi:hypothetical protein